jgi:N-acetylneuraminate synthase
MLPHPIGLIMVIPMGHIRILEFDGSQHAELMNYCEEIGIVYSTSVWDTTSTKKSF